MMKVNIIYATRYGSTGQIASWIAERFKAEGCSAECSDVLSANTTDDADLIIMGSGIYSHGFLKPLEEYIEEHKEALNKRSTALFGVAMKTEPVIYKGKTHGGILMLEKYAEKLGNSLIGCSMLHGQMIFETMNEQDKKGIDGFCRMIGCTDEETRERKKPRTLMEKKECWDFAESLIKTMKRKKQ